MLNRLLGVNILLMGKGQTPAFAQEAKSRLPLETRRPTLTFISVQFRSQTQSTPIIIFASPPHH